MSLVHEKLWGEWVEFMDKVAPGMDTGTQMALLGIAAELIANDAENGLAWSLGPGKDGRMVTIEVHYDNVRVADSLLRLQDKIANLIVAIEDMDDENWRDGVLSHLVDMIPSREAK